MPERIPGMPSDADTGDGQGGGWGGATGTAAGTVTGILGGTFDPVHYAHLRLAEEALTALGCAAVRWIPAGQPPHRAAPQSTTEHRVAMVRMAIAGNPRFILDTAEVERPEPSYTVETLRRLRAETGDRAPLVLLIGADAFAALDTWYRWRELFDLAHIAVAQRPGYSFAAERLPSPLAACRRERFVPEPQVLGTRPAGCIVEFPTTPLAISATQIRTLLAAGQSPRYLLPDTVLDYIQDNGLYRSL